MNKKKIFLLLIVFICVLCIGNTLAFLTDMETKENVFTIGGISISLTEPNWKEADAQNLVPGAVVAKNPTVTNDGKNDAYVFLSVEIPKAEVTVDKSQSPVTKESKELFSYTLNNGWQEVTTIDGTDKVKHIYAYASDANTMTKLSKSVSATLFENVKLVDFDDLGETNPNLKINVAAYAIQTENIVEGDNITPLSVWNVVKAELGL